MLLDEAGLGVATSVIIVLGDHHHPVRLRQVTVVVRQLKQ